MTVTLLSPHRDDAGFSCGLSLNRLVHAQVSVTIVNVFTISDYAPYLSQNDDDRVLQVTTMRRKEDEAFAYLLTQAGDPDKVKLLDLAWNDLPLRWNTEDDQSLAPLPLPVAEIDALSDAFAALPVHDLVLAPLALGGHVDHRLVRRAAQQAFDPSSLVFYEDLPYACRMTAGERTAAMSEHGAGLIERWLPEDRSETGLKRAYAMCYPSQIAPDTADEMERYAGEHGGRERFVAEPEPMRKLQALLHSKGAMA